MNPAPDTSKPPLTREEILLLKIAQLDLERHSVDMAIRSLLAGVRSTGKNQSQRIVLTDDLGELERRADESKAVNAFPELPKPLPGPTLPYHSFLLCFHEKHTDAYFNGLPLGKIEGETFRGHEFSYAGSDAKRPMNFGEIRGCPYPNNEAMREAIVKAIYAINLPTA